MKSKSRCLLCYKKLKEREVPSKYKDMYQEFTHVFMGYLRPKESSVILDTSLTNFYENIFPFCEECQKVVTELYRKYSQLQYSLRRIKLSMTTRRSQKILYELEKRRPVQNTEVTMETESGNQFEQERANVAEPSGLLRLLLSSNRLLEGARSGFQEATDQVGCDDRTEGNAPSADTSNTVTDTEELFVVPIAEDTGKYSLSSTFAEHKASKLLFSSSKGSPMLLMQGRP